MFQSAADFIAELQTRRKWVYSEKSDSLWTIAVLQVLLSSQKVQCIKDDKFW